MEFNALLDINVNKVNVFLLIFAPMFNATQLVNAKTDNAFQSIFA
jgi:hypothetical protein